MRKKGKRKIEHKITDKHGLSKQYPKIMKNPARYGFSWDSSDSALFGEKEYYLAKRK